MLKLLPLLLVIALSSCGKDSAAHLEVESEQHDLNSNAPYPGIAVDQNLDFQALAKRVKDLQNHGVSYFDEHWPEIRTEMLLHIEGGLFASVGEAQLEELWMSLDYVRACHRPEIFQNYSDEIVEILLALDVPEHNHMLKEILDPQEKIAEPQR